MSPRKIIAISAVALAVGAAAWWLRPAPGPARRADHGEPQKSVDEVLAERARQAGVSLQTPLGQAFARRDWVEFQRLYRPDSQFHDLAEIIRAHFVENRFSSFPAADMQQVLTFVYSTMEALRPQDWPLAGLLVTQFQRLPLPAHGSPLYQRLESWMGRKDDKTPLRRLAVIKLATQDLTPPETAVKSLIAGYRTAQDGLPIHEWIRVTDEIRSIAVRERCLKELLRAYPELKGEDRAQALISLSLYPEVSGPALSRITLEHLRSDDPGLFESGLKALAPVMSANLLNPRQKADIVKRLTHLPPALKTPYVEAKSDALLPGLSGGR